MDKSNPATFGSFENGCLHYTSEISDFGRIRTIPAVWRAYLKEFPETGHGKATKKDPNIGSFKQKTFTKEFGGRVGKAPSTIHAWHEKAVEIAEKLDAEAEAAIFGTALANNVDIVLRIARIPQAKIQRDLVNLYDRQRSEAITELKKWEEHFSPEKVDEAKKEESTPPASPQDQDDGARTEPASSKGSNDEPPEWVGQILESLGVCSPEGVLPAIAAMKAKLIELERLVVVPMAVKKARRRNASESPKTYEGDADPPAKAHFKDVVKQTLAELSDDTSLKVFGGREVPHAVWTHIKGGKHDWEITWWVSAHNKRRFEFKVGTGSDGQPTATGDGCPGNTAEMRAALRKFITRHVLVHEAVAS